MSTPKLRIGVVAVPLAAAVLACGGGYSSSSSATPTPTPSPGPTATSTGFTLTISGMRFSPLELHVPRGATVTVVNQDGAMAHSVTSEASAGAFTPGAVGGVQFDTGPFTGSRTFSIPANAAAGTTVPYYCTTHLGTMATPNGTVVVDDSAAPPSTTQTPAPAGPVTGY